MSEDGQHEQCAPNEQTNPACDDKHIIDQKCSKDDLIELVRAIKFSNPDASIRDVHNEIQTKMSQNESFEFLANVKLNDVKKVWKKAITGGGVKNNSNSSSDSTKSTLSKAQKDDDDVMDTIRQTTDKNGIIKFYTVGNVSVKTLAENYTLQAAAQAVAKEKVSNVQKEEEELNKYVHCFLDVPADCSGGKPQQALINFNKINKKSQSVTNSKSDDRDIVKIQVAAPIPGFGNMPMLLYNFNRSAKTFIHDDKDDEHQGYEKIRQKIISQGSGGALSGGGTKAYFYSRITKRKGQQDLISIDVSDVAPAQNW